MIKVDLITGFLGSGKTTFIREYARFLMAQGMKIAILENDYGAVNVDRMLLSDLEGPLCDLEMVVGGEDYETHKRRFRSKLIWAITGFWLSLPGFTMWMNFWMYFTRNRSTDGMKRERFFRSWMPR